jgi:hypothetical protein
MVTKEEEEEEEVDTRTAEKVLLKPTRVRAREMWVQHQL